MFTQQLSFIRLQNVMLTFHYMDVLIKGFSFSIKSADFGYTNCHIDIEVIHVFCTVECHCRKSRLLTNKYQGVKNFTLVTRSKF